MRTLFSAVMGLGLLVVFAAPTVAQEKASTLGTRTVMGTVKSKTANALVVKSMEQKKEREWAFSVDDTTTVRQGRTDSSLATLKEGDRVTVNYTERDGKIIAQSVTIDTGNPLTTPPARAPASAK